MTAIPRSRTDLAPPDDPRRPEPLSRRGLLRLGASCAAGLAATAAFGTGSAAGRSLDGELADRAARLVQGATVIDMLGLLTLDWPKLFRWQNDPRTFVPDDFEKLRGSGIDVFHPAVEPAAPDARRGAFLWMNGWNRMISNHPDFFVRVDTLADLDLAASTPRIGMLLGLQNSRHLEAPDDVFTFFGAGQRISQLTYNQANALGSGCHEPTDGGLTSLGREIVRTMNHVGMAIDISHCGPRTSLEAIEASSAPVLATHTNCLALAPGQVRNKSDELIRRLAARGGVVGITNVRRFVGRGTPDLDDWLDHFEHVAQLVGVDHVGIGSDIDIDAVDRLGRPLPFYRIRGLDPARRAFQLAEGLLQRGYRERDIRKVLGGNFRRALRAIWPPPPNPGDDRRAFLPRDADCTGS